MKREEFVFNIYNIISEKNTFLSLKEIYDAYRNKYDCNNFANLEANIRTAIYDRCINRDRLQKDKKILFISLFPKKTIGNKYGLFEWRDRLADDVNESDVDSFISEVQCDKHNIDAPVIIGDSFMNYTYYEKVKRRAINASIAIANADFCCEVDKEHFTFIRKSNNKNYTEAHYLIPLKYQNEFEYSLDVPANIVSLCSNCHNCLHYGINKEGTLRKLYDERIDRLNKCKIYISFEKLCEYYNL